jgi:hypothetical protein
VVVQTVKAWFRSHTDWLLVLDNADHLELVRDWLPLKEQGHILLTTRASETRPLALCIGVMTMSPQEGALFLLRRSGQLPNDGAWTQAASTDQALALTLCQTLDGLPLALDQAGAYILETPSSLAEYSQLYQTAAPKLLAQRGQNAFDHPSVTVTFSLAIQVASQQFPAITDFLNLCAFLAADGIPEELFQDHAMAFEPPLQASLADGLEFVELLKAAGRFSLITRTVDDHTFAVHRLVQAVIRERLDTATQDSLIRQILEAMNQSLPEGEFAAWPIYDRLLPHALMVAQWRRNYTLETQSASRLLNQIAVYLSERGRYGEAEPLSQEALAMRKRLLGNEHPYTQGVRRNLERLRQKQDFSPE